MRTIIKVNIFKQEKNNKRVKERSYYHAYSDFCFKRERFEQGQLSYCVEYNKQGDYLNFDEDYKIDKHFNFHFE